MKTLLSDVKDGRLSAGDLSAWVITTYWSIYESDDTSLRIAVANLKATLSDIQAGRVKEWNSVRSRSSSSNA